MAGKIKFIRKPGYHPCCIIGDTKYMIQEYLGSPYQGQSGGGLRAHFALVSIPADGLSKTWGFTNGDDVFRFINGICPGYKHLFSCGEKRLYSNSEWEVVLAVHHDVLTYMDMKQFLALRDKYLVLHRDVCYYEVTKRKALRIIKEGMYDLKEAMDFTVEYLTRLLEQQSKILQPSLFD